VEKSTHDWLLEYRVCQLLGKQVNECLGAYFLPIHVSEIMLLAVIASYVLIRLDIDFIFVVSLITLDVLIIYFFSFWKKATVFTKLSTAAIESQKAKSKYSKLVCKSCRPISIFLGEYYVLSEVFLLGAFAAIVNYTIQLLLIY
jgi:hypothetical protein